MKAFQAAAGSCLDVNRVVPDMSVRRGKLTEVQSVTVIIPTYRRHYRKSWESPLARESSNKWRYQGITLKTTARRTLVG
jgi:hypothetical protein